jgi:hypothetical protein
MEVLTGAALLRAARKRAAEVQDTHRSNLAELKAKRAAYIASWPLSDAELARRIAKIHAEYDHERAEMMASFDRGLAAFSAATGIAAKWED